MKRRMLAAVLSLMMLLGLMIPAASAKEATGPALTMTASETTAHPGDTITYTITMGPVEELLSVQMQIDLPQGLTYVERSGKVADGLTGKMNFDAYPVTWTEESRMLNGYGLRNNYTSAQDTVLATFQCTVDQGASGDLSVGLTNLSVACGSFIDGDAELVTDTVQVTPAQLTVVIPATGVRLDRDSITVKQGETQTLTATLEPADASDQTVTFTSSNTAVAAVDPDGTVHALSEGQATITVTTRDGGFQATCLVTVPHEHSYNTQWSHDGQYHWHECTAGDGAVSDKAAHTGGAATCERQAVCEVCGAPYGELADHTLNHVDRVEPTHFADGNIEYWECSVCHKLFSDAQGTTEISQEDTVLAKIPHDYGTDWVTDESQHWHACSCGAKADVAQHSFAWIIDREPTEDQTGLKHQECTVCGFSRSEDTVIDKLDHDLTFHPAVEATCTQEGNVAYYSCANCGRNFADADATQVLNDVVTPVDPDNHAGKTELKNVVEATCTQDGYSGDLYCADCGELVTEGTVIPATGHSLERVDRVEPTHTADGHIEYWQCAACGALFADQEGQNPLSAEDVVLAQIPHSFGEHWESDATGHWHACDCGAKSDAAGHTFGAWKTTKEATQTETGSRERVCTVCGYVETQTLAVLAPVDNGGQQSATSQNPDGQNVGSQNSADGQSKTASPKTGDQSLMGIGLGALALAGVGLTVLTVMGKKKRQEQ